jgi:molecular chaperone DnaJ
MSDYYELLGVPSDATADEIKKAYRRRARQLHPDANPGDPATEERFKEVARAYEVLADPELRARYDRFGEAGLGRGGSDPFQASGFGDIFDAFFGGGSPFGGGQGPSGPPRGQDLEVVADVSFEDAVFGTRLPVTIKTAVLCDDCEGSGSASGTRPTTCPECGGLGQVRRVRQSLFGQMMTAGPCPRCAGSGQVIAQPCRACRGEGRRLEDRTYHVDVPAGIDTGSTLRLIGRGAVGPRGGGAGDLYVHLRVRPHDRFRREGYDLATEVAVSFPQAVLGAHLSLETLDGDEALTIPPGTQPGRQVRVRNKGVPHVEGRGRGDLVVHITVDVPSRVSVTEEELVRRLAQERGDAVDPPTTGLVGRIKSAFK